MFLTRRPYSAILLAWLMSIALIMLAPTPAALAGADADTDGDGISDSIEQVLGTNPNSFDTDCDTYDDKTEVGDSNNPTDTDGDGLIDARENNLTGDQTDGASRQHVTCFRFTPFVIADDGVDSARVEVRVESPADVGGVVVPVDMLFSSVSDLLLDGSVIAYGNDIELFDDGSHGDLLAGDRVWTRSGFTVKTLTPSLGERELRVDHLRKVRVLDAQGGTLFEKKYGDFFGISGGAELGIVSRHALRDPLTPSPGVQVVAHVAAIVDPAANLLVGRPNNNWAPVARAIYQRFPDDYDFLVLYEDYDRSVISYAGYSRLVSNSVTGIGSAVFDITQFYGSAGRLQGISWIGFSNGGPLGHEFMHRWAAPLLPSLGLNLCTGNPPSIHWGVAGVGKGMLGGYDPATLVDNGNGTYTVGDFGPSANWVSLYNPLELYLAGMLPASQVPSIQVPTNVDCSSLISEDSDKRTFRAGGLQTFTIQQVQDALGGPRNPPFEQAQKQFTVGSFVVVPRPLTPAELAFFNVRSESISRENDPDFYRYSFSQLTKGVGTMTTRMIDVSTDGIDTWVAAPAIVSTRSADTANIPIRLGNAGGSAAAATTLTLTMDSSLTYLTDTLDVTPTVATSGNLTTVRWQWPAMSSVAQRSGVVSVTVPDAPIGTAFEFAIAIGVENEAIPENNSVSGQISISEFVFLPTIQAGQ